MNYVDTLTYLYESQPAFHLVGAAAYKPGFDNTISLMAHLGNPHQKLRCVHIAGTNGKGSTSHLIAATLQASGLRVGLYTSPHLMDFRERIRISGQMIPEERVVRFVEENRTFLDDLRPSFFETTMALAFQYFAEEQVDIAVIEVGLGGRLDSTNILPAWNPVAQTGVMLSVITNIGLDHTEFLGSTIASIAGEKAGIIKQGVPVIIGEDSPEIHPVFTHKAEELQAPCIFAEKEQMMPDLPCQLTGTYQQKNKQTAYVALVALQKMMMQVEPLAHISFDYPLGFSQVCTLTGLRGRWERLSSEPLTICDTGHNSHGVRTYVEQLKLLGEGRTLRIIFGMVGDKDVDTVLSLLPKEAFYYWTEGPTHRAIPANQMRLKGLAHGLIGTAYTTVETAIRAAQQDARNALQPANTNQLPCESVLFIGGSNYVVGEALKLF